MSQQNTITIQDLNEMRDIGRALYDRGFVEVDTSNGAHTWANEFILSKVDYTIDEFKKLDVNDITPEEFQDSMISAIDDIKSGRGFKFSIRPTIASNGKIVWWYSIRVKTKLPYVWFRCEYLNTTDRFGIEYSSMVAAMNTTNSYNDLYNKIQELQVWTEDAVNRLGRKDEELERKMMELADNIRQTKRFAETAANAGLELKQTMINFQTEIANEMAKQTTDIIRLISNDVFHSKRMENIESQIRKATITAMESITERASVEGKGMAKNVVIPVSIITLMSIIIQLIINNH